MILTFVLSSVVLHNMRGQETTRFDCKLDFSSKFFSENHPLPLRRKHGARLRCSAKVKTLTHCTCLLTLSFPSAKKISLKIALAREDQSGPLDFDYKKSSINMPDNRHASGSAYPPTIPQEKRTQHGIDPYRLNGGQTQI